MRLRRHINVPRCLTCLIPLLFSCQALADAIPLMHYTLVRTLPREAGHFTQGLVFNGDVLYESTGKYGQSRLITYQPGHFQPIQQLQLGPDCFAEGITILKHQLYQLDWRSGVVRVYNLELKLEETLALEGEGWGITSDGQHLITSDGSEQLTFRQPNDLKVIRQITVHDKSGKTWNNLNELEWINGVLLANVWHRDNVLVINPETGLVVGQYDFERLSQQAGKKMSNRTGEQVLNGLAWRSSDQVLLLTGKDWPVWFETKLDPIPSKLEESIDVRH